MAELKRLENGNLELTFSLAWADIQKAREHAVDHAVSEAKIEGFRPGKAPRYMVEPQLDQNKLLSAGVQELLPKAYSQAVTEHHLHPILNPKVTITSGQTGQDWQFTAITCESPAIDLPNYKVGIRKLPQDPVEGRLDRIVDYLHREAKVQVPDLLVEEEANHRLAALVDNVSRLGLSVDGYLSAKKLTPETLKAQIASEARSALQVELILNRIQQAEKLPDRKSVLDF